MDPKLAFVLYLLALGLFVAGGVWSAVTRSGPIALGLFGLALVDLVWLTTAAHTAF